MRRSRRWIELRATAGTGSPEPGGREEPQHPGSPDDECGAVASDGPERTDGREVGLPSPSPSPSPFLELTSLAARIAMAPILESGRYFRAVTAHTARSAQARRVDHED